MIGLSSHSKFAIELNRCHSSTQVQFYSNPHSLSKPLRTQSILASKSYKIHSWQHIGTQKRCLTDSRTSIGSPSVKTVYFYSHSLNVSSIKYTTNCLCYMHWLSFISFIFIGILPIIHPLYFSCFCTAEALWTLMDPFQLYSHLVRIRSAA